MDPFEHPQLGTVELGGLDYMRTVRNPPITLLATECERGFAVAQSLRKALPRVRGVVTVTPIGDESFRVDLCLENLGFLATSGSQHGEKLPGTPSVQARFLPNQDCALSTPSEVVLSHLQGWGSIHPGGPHSVYPTLPNQGHRDVATWVVTGTGDFTIQWTGGRGGRGTYTGTLTKAITKT